VSDPLGNARYKKRVPARCATGTLFHALETPHSLNMSHMATIQSIMLTMKIAMEREFSVILPMISPHQNFTPNPSWA
jgi:hypothetical protein